MEIKINEMVVDCVGNIEPDFVVDYDYDVQTLNGVIHRKTKGVKTNYDIVFFNRTDGVFYQLIKLFAKGEKVSLTLPVDGVNTITADFYPEIQGYDAKGRLSDGTFYHNGLEVSFERVAYDE